MIMRMTWGKLRPGSWNDFEKTYRATVAVKGGKVIVGDYKTYRSEVKYMQ